MRHWSLLDFRGSGEIHTFTQSPTNIGQEFLFLVFRSTFDRLPVNKFTFLAALKITRFLTSIKNRVLYCIFNLVFSYLWSPVVILQFCHREFVIKVFNSIRDYFIGFQRWGKKKRETSKLPKPLFVFLNPVSKDCLVFLGDQCSAEAFWILHRRQRKKFLVVKYTKLFSEACE